EGCKVRFDRDQTKVTHPPLKITTQLREAMRHRHTAIAASDLFDSVTELLLVLRADSNLTAPPHELKAEKLDSFRAADAALLMIDHQLQFASQIVFNRTGHTNGGFPGFGEDEEIVRIADEVQTTAFQFLVEVVQQ